MVTNDPKNSRITIGMKGIVFAPIHMTQRYVHLKGALGEEIEKVINLRGQKKDPLIVKVSSVSIPDKIEVELNEMEKGRSYQLKVKNKVEKETSYGGEVKLTTNYPETPKVWIPVSGHIRPPVEVRPKVVTFGRMSKDRLQQLKKNGRAMRRSVTVLLNNGNDVKIGKVESEKSLFKVVTREVKPGRMVQVSVEPILEKLKKGRNADRLKILTNQRNAELIVVPISFEILQANDDTEVTADDDEDMDGDEADEDELDDDEDDANDD